MRRNGLPDEACFTGGPRHTHAAPLRLALALARAFLQRVQRFPEIARSYAPAAKPAGAHLAPSRGKGYGPREGSLNGEKNARTPRARPVPRRRVTAASLRGVARSRDWIAAAAA